MTNTKLILKGCLAALIALIPSGALHASSESSIAFVTAHGPAFNLSADAVGNIYYSKRGSHAAAAIESKPLAGASLERFSQLSERIAGQDPNAALVPVLQALLRPRLGDSHELHGISLYKGQGDTLRLTVFGRNILMDLLTAADGEAFAGPAELYRANRNVRGDAVLRRLTKEGQLLDVAQSALTKSTVFDGSFAATPQIVVPMERFGKWDELEQGKIENVYIDPQTGNMRLIVAAHTAVFEDRFKVLKGEQKKILSEAGLDGKMLRDSGAKVVRAIDNLLEIDVSKEKAAGLGRALEQMGLSAAPNLAVAMKTAGQQLAKSRMPFGGLVPWTKKVLRSLTGGEYRAQVDAAKDILKTGTMWEKGMEGEGTIVAVIDTGLDRNHPDFKDRVLTYVDLAQGGKDSVGHGTHVAGAVGGDGAASDGKYKGLAPKTKFVVIQVFNSLGMGASEMSLLAAMKICASLPKSMRPDVISMSLGINNPIGNNLHSTSLYASYMTIRNNILVSIAGGNSGPEKYTIGAPGNSRYALTVTGTDKNKEIPFFPSRGPIVNWPFKEYNKPDLATIAGGVDRDNPCPYAPGGLIAAKSGEENFPRSGGDKCNAPDNDKYRYMSGTSMATPLASGIAADIIGYLKAHGVAYTASEVKALMMETADDLGRPAWEQGAGIVNGERLAAALEERVRVGVAAGNVAHMLAAQLTPFHAWFLEEYEGMAMTEAGLLDTKRKHLVHNDVELDALRETVDQRVSRMSSWEIMKVKIRFALRKGAR